MLGPAESWGVPHVRHTPNIFALFATPQWVRRLVSVSAARPLDQQDIPHIAADSGTQALLAQFNALMDGMRGTPYSEFRCVARMFAPDLVTSFLLGTAVVALPLARASVMRIVLLSLEQQGAPARAPLVALVVAYMALIAAGWATYSAWLRAINMIDAHIRALLTLVIYDKALRLSPREAYDEPQITVLILNDVERIVEISIIVMFVSTLFVLSAILALQFDLLGPASLVYVVALVAFFAVYSVFGPPSLRACLSAIQAADFRIGLLRELLKNIHIVKFYGWEAPLAATINDYYRLSRSNLSVVNVIAILDSVMRTMLGHISSCACFALYIYFQNNLISADRAFPSIFISQLVFHCASMSNDAYTCLFSGIHAARRINAFLNAAEREVVGGESVLGVLPSTARYAYLLRRCCIGQSARLIVTNLNAKIPIGTITAVTGPVGCGKSTLLAALQGLTDQTMKGISRREDLRVASVTRNWTRNGSIRDNILFGCEWDSQKYERVVSLCCLFTDFAALPDGDLTEIGDGGATLSGGQRTRISLARCLYSDADVYILDDVLAAVDVANANLILAGLWRTVADGSKTVILSSNDYKILPVVSQILFLDGQGGYLWGSYDGLLTCRKFADAVESAINVPDLDTDSDDERGGSLDGDDDDDGDNEDEGRGGTRGVTEIWASSPTEETTSFARSPSRFTLSNAASMYASAVPRTAPETAASARVQALSCVESRYSAAGASVFSDRDGRAPHGALFDLIDKETLETMKTKRGFIWQLFQLSLSGSWQELTLSSSLTILESLLRPAPIVVLGFIVSSHTVDAQISLLGLLFGTVGLRLVLLLASLIVIQTAASGTVMSIHKAAVHNLFESPMSYFESVPMGRFMERFTVDLSVVYGLLQNVIPAFVAIMTQIVMYAIIISWMEPIVGVVLVFLMIRWVKVWWNPPAAISESMRLRNLTESKTTSMIMESLNGFAVMADYSQQMHGVETMAEAQDDRLATIHASIAVRQYWSQRVILQILPWMTAIPVLSVLIRSEPSPAMIGLMLVSIELFHESMRELLVIVNQVNMCFYSMSRLTELVSGLPKEHYEGRKPKPWRAAEGAVEFRNAYFQYRRQLPFVLNKFNLTLKGGEKLGICGRTGAGKTTIFNALFRFSELRRGQIFIDGQDVACLGVRELRSSLAVIPQQTVLFRGTIRSNLDPTQEQPDELLWDALRRSGFCKATTKQVYLDYKVEAEGVNFSLGERQLIALARALVRRCQIILLDEATSSVDYATDRLIQQTMQREFASCTVLCIAHRIQTIVKYDRVLVMGMGGNIAEIGEPAELYRRRGLFWELCEEAAVQDDDFM